MLEIRGEGGLRKNRGRWQATFSVVDTVSGERTTVTRMTSVPCRAKDNQGISAARLERAGLRADVSARLRDASSIADIKEGSHEPTLAEALESYIEGKLAKEEITESTAYFYHQMAKPIKNGLGSIEVSRIRRGDVMAWIDRSSVAGMNPSHIMRVLKLGRQFYAYVNLGREPDAQLANPFEGTGFKARPVKSENVIKRDSLVTLNAALSLREDDRLHRAIFIALHTGMRRGEVCALRWDDIDLAAQRLTVAKSLTWSNSLHKPVMKSPKNGESRTIPIDSQLAGYLRDVLRDEFKFIKCKDGSYSELMAFKRRRGDRFVCSPYTGEIFDPHLITRSFKRFVRTNGIEGTEGEPTFHTLRHTYATTWISAGGDVRALAHMLGHKDVSMTLNVYASADIEAVKRGARLSALPMSAGGAVAASDGGTESVQISTGLAGQLIGLGRSMGLSLESVVDVALRAFLEKTTGVEPYRVKPLQCRG